MMTNSLNGRQCPLSQVIGPDPGFLRNPTGGARPPG